ncbi:MAG: hypothetical protein ACW991_03005, partial [Candidatus Hodarchaeales archaeon]
RKHKTIRRDKKENIRHVLEHENKDVLHTDSQALHRTAEWPDIHDKGRESLTEKGIPRVSRELPLVNSQ